MCECVCVCVCEQGLGLAGLAGPLAPWLLTGDERLHPHMAAMGPAVFGSLAMAGAASPLFKAQYRAIRRDKAQYRAIRRNIAQ